MFLRMSIRLVILICRVHCSDSPRSIQCKHFPSLRISHHSSALEMRHAPKSTLANVQLQQQSKQSSQQTPRTHHSPLPPPHTTQCSASAPPRALRSRCPLSATPLPAAGLPALAQRASRALPTMLSTAREPLLSSMLLTLLVSALEGVCWALVGED
jgi:hypothetical protein